MNKSSSPATTPWPSQLRPLLEDALERFLPAADAPPEPLHRAMRYAVFAGGKRLRPQFLLHVAQACCESKAQKELALRAACAVELIHIASLVHDDLPCFDNATERRGRPTVHVLFGEARALLVGDALLARSFEILATAPRSLAGRSLRLLQLLACATGSSSGLVCGQGLEQDRAGGSPDGVESYYEAKTGTLFRMAAEAAAVVAGSSQVAAWAQVGWLVGRGYKLAHSLTTLQEDGRPHAARGVDASAAAPGDGGTVLRYTEAALRAQLHALSTTLHERIRGLAAAPMALLSFLDELCGPLLQRPAAVPSSVQHGEAVHPDPASAHRAEAESA